MEIYFVCVVPLANACGSTIMPSLWDLKCGVWKGRDCQVYGTWMTQMLLNADLHGFLYTHTCELVIKGTLIGCTRLIFR
ncbi:MAG: hypothetical protein A2X12_07650 [Bacteroidetes bacterium GWE2_29_8]|nr:MAG: hypothetical protein A2X12_07650 [Bacteroidetes bacterium GWE2_29_8]OFY22731.1 MAG: hypothetical protein A2X02_02135 [Bacteroidetes bacterium GWF2_29_10]